MQAKLHLSICTKWVEVAFCYGITRNPLNNAHFLVMPQMDLDLRKYLQQNYNKLSWKKKKYNSKPQLKPALCCIINNIHAK